MSEPLDELSEEGLIAASRYRRRAMSGGDTQALARFLHPNFIINGPNNRSGGREHILQLSENGAIAPETCRTEIERTAITGNIGIVMGNDVVTPPDGSLLADWFGTKPLRRRFTDVYVFEGGKWLFLAAQASVVREATNFRS
jgi:hypothetical protein